MVDGRRRSPGPLRWLAIVGIVLLIMGAARAGVPGVGEVGDPDDPFDLTAEGRSCMQRQGFDAHTLRFSAGRDGRVGFNSTATDDLRTLDPIVPRIDGTKGGAQEALDRCLAELRPVAESLAPSVVAVDPSVVAAVEDCLASGPYGDLLTDVRVRAWDDGTMSVGTSHPDLDATTQAGLDAEVRRCFPVELGD